MKKNDILIKNNSIISAIKLSVYQNYVLEQYRHTYFSFLSVLVDKFIVFLYYLCFEVT